MIAAIVFLSCLIGTHTDARAEPGDDAFYSIDYPDAVSSYEAELNAHADDPQILWRLARVFVCMGEVDESSRRDTLFLTAARFARKCIRADSTLAEGHTWLAGALGYLALDAPVKEQLELTRELLSETACALTLDPEDDVAYSIRGSCYRALGNVGWLQRQIAAILYGSVPSGGFPEAESALKKAAALAPDVMRHAYELGILYIDWGRAEEARTVLERAATMPVRTAIDRPRLKKIRKLLEELGPAK